MSWLDQLAEIRSVDWNEAESSTRNDKAQEVIRISAYAGAAASVVPVPMAELALLLPIHTAMVMTIGHVQGRTLSRAEAARVAVELGAIAGLTFASTAALSVIRKIVLPGVGGVLAAPASFALTWGLGQVALAYFQNPSISREELKTVFSEAFREGKSSFSKERFDSFRDEHGEGSTVVNDADAATPERPEARTPSDARGPAVDPNGPKPSPASENARGPHPEAQSSADAPVRAPDTSDEEDDARSEDGPTDLRPRRRSL